MVGGNTESSGLKFGAAAKGRLEEVSVKLDQAISSSEHLAADSRQVRAELLEIESKMHEASGAGGASSVTMKALEDRRTELKNKLAASKEEMVKKSSELEAVSKAQSDLTPQAEACMNDLNLSIMSRDTNRQRMEELAPKDSLG